MSNIIPDASLQWIMRDQIASIPTTPVILNLDTSNNPGTHWTTFMRKSRTVLYFDSFGMPPPQELVDLAKKKRFKIIYNERQIQDESSTACGYFALYAAANMYKGNYPQCLDVFSDDLKKNDKIVHAYF